MEVHMSQYVENNDENEEDFGEFRDPDELNEVAFDEKTLKINENTDNKKNEPTNKNSGPTTVELEANKINPDILHDHEEANDELKPFYKSWLLYILLVGFGLFIGINLYFKSQIKIYAPKVDLGEKVVIILENGQEMKTYENLLVEKEKKVYYKGEFNTIDVTDGIIVYKDWE
jgi:hypothetical protein